MIKCVISELRQCSANFQAKYLNVLDILRYSDKRVKKCLSVIVLYVIVNCSSSSFFFLIYLIILTTLKRMSVIKVLTKFRIV